MFTSPERGVRVYAVSTDGLTEAMVAAKTMDEAAAALGTSVADMRKSGWHAVKGPAAVIATKHLGEPLYRSIAGAKPGVWTLDRSEASATAARAVLRAGRY